MGVLPEVVDGAGHDQVRQTVEVVDSLEVLPPHGKLGVVNWDRVDTVPLEKGMT